MNYKRLIYCLLVLICVSCRNKQEVNNTSGEKNDFINLDKKAKEDKISYMTFFKKIVLVPLETNKESVIDRIDKIVRDNNKFYILDKKQKAILIFNQKGEFIKKLKQVGRGPGEYQYLNDFEINRFTKYIELLEPWGVINVYDSLGNFIEKYRLPASIRAVHFFAHINSDTIVFYTTSEKNRLTFFSKKQNRVITQYHEIPEWISRNTPLNPGRSPFFIYNDTINFFEVFSNDVYSIVKCDLKLRYSWDFGKNNFSYKDLPENKTLKYNMDYLNSSSYAYNIFYNIENERYRITSIRFYKKAYTVFLDKITNRYFHFNEFKEGIGISLIGFFEKGCYSAIGMENLKKFVIPDVLDSENQTILKSLKVENNPIIIEYYY